MVPTSAGPATASAFDMEVMPSGPLGGYVDVPPSKNYTTRMILAAALAQGTSFIDHPADNDDARALVDCCRALGARIDRKGTGLEVTGVAGRPAVPGTLNPGNAGAVLRLLLGVACLVEGEVRFVTDHAESLGRRPNRELVEALRAIGASIEAEGSEATLPITVSGGRDRLTVRDVTIDCSRSSQFLSSLLFLAPHLPRDLEINVAPSTSPDRPALVSRPLIEQTLDVLERFGARVEAAPDRLSFHIPGNQTLKAGAHRVPGDWPSAAALMAAIAVAGGMGTLRGLTRDAQGERRVLDAFVEMGCDFHEPRPGELSFHSHGDLRAVHFNGDLATDAVLALEAAACLADGVSRIDGIANLRLKESDRIADPLRELARLGIEARSGDDWVEIVGRPEGFDCGGEVDSHGDHRVAQMLAVVGSRCARGLTIRGAHCVSKSYPGFFEDLARLGVKLRRLPAS